MRTLSFVVVAVSATLASTALAQNPFAQMTETRKAINARDTARAFALLDSIRLATPDHVNYPYLSAHANGMAGRYDAARANIAQLLRWDPRYARAALRDTSIASLRRDFAQVDSLAKLAETPISTGTVWATIAERDLVPEGTAWDATSRSVLVGSLNKYKIVAIAQDGSVTDRVSAGTGGLHSVVGIHVDGARRMLWALSNPRFDTPQDSTAPALLGFDLARGTFKRRVGLPATRDKRFLNDLTTGRDGTVYITDTQSGKVWFAPPDASELRELTTLGPILAPNGITISSDGRVLFVADVDHVQALEISTGKTWRVEVPDSVNLTGIDGLAFHANTLIAHHPLSNWRLVRYSLDSDWHRITGRQVIDANTPDGRTSTTGEIAGDDYFYIGNSQIDRMNAKTIDAATMDPVRIYRATLSNRQD
jgi:sugar lactone lactonase YvrE